MLASTNDDAPTILFFAVVEEWHLPLWRNGNKRKCFAIANIRGVARSVARM